MKGAQWEQLLHIAQIYLRDDRSTENHSVGRIDLSIGKDTHDPAGFIPGSFRAEFYDTFWREIDTGTGVNDYEQHPDHYVSRYGANYFHEDIADTFAVFVLGAKPENNTVAEQKLLFFWDHAEMVTLRQEIRHNLGLE